MDNPHEERQAVLLERIIKNVEKCNEAILEMNHCANEIAVGHMDTAIAANLFTNYSKNVRYNLEAIGIMPEPK